MALAGLLNPPDDAQKLLRWAFTNADGHTRIIEAISAQGGGDLTRYILDPIAQFDRDNWLLRHQTAHNDMNAVLGIEGADLSDVDFEKPAELAAWVQLHFVEHQQANFKLRI